MVRDVMRHRALGMRTGAAYVAYSSAWNNSAVRVAERQAQTAGAEECESVVREFEKALESHEV